VNDDNDVEIRAVLDASAMLSYARGHVHVGELMTEIGSEDAWVAIPVVSLIDAAARLTGDSPARGRMAILATLPSAIVLSPTWRDALTVSSVVPFTSGDLSRAHAVAVALEHRAYYLTTEPDLAPSVLDKDMVVAIPENDA
jgi:hypothetical protein